MEVGKKASFGGFDVFDAVEVEADGYRGAEDAHVEGREEDLALGKSGEGGGEVASYGNPDKVKDQADEGAQGGDSDFVGMAVVLFGQENVGNPGKVVAHNKRITGKRVGKIGSGLEGGGDNDDEGADNAKDETEPFVVFLFFFEKGNAAEGDQNRGDAADEGGFQGGSEVQAFIKKAVAEGDLDKFDEEDGNQGFTGERGLFEADDQERDKDEAGQGVS